MILNNKELFNTRINFIGLRNTYLFDKCFFFDNKNDKIIINNADKYG